MSLHAQSTFTVCYLSSQLGQRCAPPCERRCRSSFELSRQDGSHSVSTSTHVHVSFTHDEEAMEKRSDCWTVLTHNTSKLSPIGRDFSSLDQSLVYCTRTEKLHTVQLLDLICDKPKYQFPSCTNLIFRKAAQLNLYLSGCRSLIFAVFRCLLITLSSNVIIFC